jgi:hypothetical protein
MNLRKIAFSIFGVLAATIPSFLILIGISDGEQSVMEQETWFSTWLWILTASALSFTAWCLAKQMNRVAKQLKVGVGGSYAGFLLLFLLAGAYHGQPGETIMWSPIYALFGIPIMAPCVGLSWLASSLLLGFTGTEKRGQQRDPSNPHSPSAQGLNGR